MYDPQALATAETYLIHMLESSDPPREASGFKITEAAQEFHDTTGNWDLRSADLNVVVELLGRHAK